MGYPVVLLEHASQSYSSSSSSPMCLPPVLRSIIYSCLDIVLTAILVPLATLVSATRPPTKTQDAILSPEGVKRYFITHGGLFSKDGITLDEIRKINRIGRQPGTEGLMCTFLFLFVTSLDFERHSQVKSVLQTLHRWRLNTE